MSEAEYSQAWPAGKFNKQLSLTKEDGRQQEENGECECEKWLIKKCDILLLQDREIPEQGADNSKPGTSKPDASDDSKPRISKVLKGLKFEEATDEQMKANSRLRRTLVRTK